MVLCDKMKPLNFKKFLESVLNGKIMFCTLCFNNLNTEEALVITDKVILKSNTEQSVVDILKFILGSDAVNDFLSEFICMQCIESALSCYLSLRGFKDNIEAIPNMIRNILNSVNSSLEENLVQAKTMYLLYNDKQFKSQSYYDTKCDIRSKAAAKLRLQSFLSEDIEEIIISIEPEEREQSLRQTIRKSNYDDVDIMCEKDGETSIKCKVCSKVYGTKTNFRSHYVRVHGPKTFKCPKCPKHFGSNVILQQHKMESHLEAVCSQCGKTYNNRHYLKVHELSHKVSFTCQVCKGVYKTQETYKMHLTSNICRQKERKTQLDAMFTCDICKKKFCRKASLKVHIQFEHGNGKAYVCKWCNKRFSAQSRLNAHAVKHTKVKNFCCTTCNSKFVTKESLLYHTRIHTGIKPYKCNSCDAAFVSSSRRSVHVQRHHRDIQFECVACHSKFKSKSSMKNHIKLKCSSTKVKST